MPRPNSIGYDRLKRAYNMKRLAPSKLAESCAQELENVANRGKQLKRYDTHLYDFGKRKEPYFLLYQILDCINKGPKHEQTITKIQYYCCLSWCQMKYYFHVLERAHLIIRHEAIRIHTKRRHVFYSITWRGQLYLIKYRDLKKLCFNINDKLNLFGDIEITKT